METMVLLQKILLKKISLQSRKDFEIVFCDNNSSDETLSVLRKFNEVKESSERLIERIKAEIEVEGEGDIV